MKGLPCSSLVTTAGSKRQYIGYVGKRVKASVDSYHSKGPDLVNSMVSTALQHMRQKEKEDMCTHSSPFSKEKDILSYPQAFRVILQAQREGMGLSEGKSWEQSVTDALNSMRCLTLPRLSKISIDNWTPVCRTPPAVPAATKAKGPVPCHKQVSQPGQPNRLYYVSFR